MEKVGTPDCGSTDSRPGLFLSPDVGRGAVQVVVAHISMTANRLPNRQLCVAAGKATGPARNLLERYGDVQALKSG
jgi:hypothetical protein